jgi:hypothetical protein
MEDNSKKREGAQVEAEAPPEGKKSRLETAGQEGAVAARSSTNLVPEPGSLPYDRHTPNYKPERGLQVPPTVKEVTERYRIELSLRVDNQLWLNEDWTPELQPLITEKRLLEGGFCPEGAVRRLWKEKMRIDSFFDGKQEGFYYRARNSIFPQDQKGSERFRNRAGDKLFEVHEETALFHPSGGVFFDVCGGPGAWSEVLLKVEIEIERERGRGGGGVCTP